MRILLTVLLALSMASFPVSSEEGTQHIRYLQTVGMDYWKSRGLQFVTIMYLKEESSESGGKVCYQIEHPMEDIPYLGCIELINDQVVADVTSITKKE